jgi:hypothetical protein
MTDLETKKLLIQRIVAYLNPVPQNCVQELLGQSVQDLGVILDRLVTTKAQGDSEETVIAHREDSRRESALEGAWVHALRNVWLNGKLRLVDCESNRSILENSLQPHEQPSAAIYSTIALSYPTKFSWELPKVQPTKEDQRKAFDAFVRENGLSSVEANFNLFKEGADVEHFAGASGIERSQYADEQAHARQKFLINSASSTQLRDEARFQSATDREIFLKAEADRQHQVSLSRQQQSGMFPPLPATHAETGVTIDARWLRKTSTINFELFKKLCKRHGSAAVTSRLRGEN